MPVWAVGVAGRRMGSLDLEVASLGFTTAGPARFVAELLVYASPVDLRSSSLGFPSIEMLADLPLVWMDGLVMVVDGGYLLVEAVFSFLAITSFVAIVIDLARRPGTGGAPGALALALVAVFFKLFVELLELEATETDETPPRAPYLGSLLGDAFRGTDASRVLDDLIGICGMPVFERTERERGIDDMAVTLEGWEFGEDEVEDEAGLPNGDISPEPVSALRR
ncbi:uncharacterized protein Triagg1_5009 [Trichoderma aggressivum f. europaeum]|uniref:Uncharacterized protein n=1 Tax=Trichoderma aggressivum f. europaeum TaxID=173218 RepID=A0AAE1IFB8_9HYPO|nr:hypothetical protein Triagg1_5009 [Trichoderma aggressivum f. europaeum]